jgi:23S rRNA (adenine2503-C2)-methyltransferase
MTIPKNLVGHSYDELIEEMKQLQLPAFRGKQVGHGLYVKGAEKFSHISTLSKDLQARLQELFALDRPTISQDQKSSDGTRKWLLKMADGQEVECVHIPDVTDGRGALCISSQVGCTLTCKFCHTGTQRWSRNLTAGEIVGQVMLARDALGEWGKQSQDRAISNLVFMGMGEPLFNYDEVAKAIRVLLDPDGISFSKRRITVSTSGVVPEIKRLGDELNVNLAVSLHAVNDDLRDKIVPLNRKYPLKQLLDACAQYPGVSNSRRITFEYVMLKDVNDSDQDAKTLTKILRNVPSKLNLIPFNPWPGAPFECSDADRIQRFGDILNDAGYVSTTRKTRGADIMAACGQLKSASMRLTASERAAIEALQKEKEAAQGLA